MKYNDKYNFCMVWLSIALNLHALVVEACGALPECAYQLLCVDGELWALMSARVVVLASDGTVLRTVYNRFSGGRDMCVSGGGRVAVATLQAGLLMLAPMGNGCPVRRLDQGKYWAVTGEGEDALWAVKEEGEAMVLLKLAVTSGQMLVRVVTGLMAGSTYCTISGGRGGSLYLSSRLENCLYEVDAVSGRPVLQLGRWGGLPGEFRWPVTLYGDGDGRMLVTDMWNQRLQLYEGGTWLPVATRGEELVEPWALAGDGKAGLWVASGKHPEYTLYHCHL